MTLSGRSVQESNYGIVLYDTSSSTSETSEQDQCATVKRTDVAHTFIKFCPCVLSLEDAAII